jgi:hypothetical protein
MLERCDEPGVVVARIGPPRRSVGQPMLSGGSASLNEASRPGAPRSGPTVVTPGWMGRRIDDGRAAS